MLHIQSPTTTFNKEQHSTLTHC